MITRFARFLETAFYAMGIIFNQLLSGKILTSKKQGTFSIFNLILILATLTLQAVLLLNIVLRHNTILAF